MEPWHATVGLPTTTGKRRHSSRGVGARPHVAIRGAPEVGDRQVANIATENEAHSIGAHVWRPFLAAGRTSDVSPAWGLPEVPSTPFNGSVLVMWDFGGPAPPPENVPPPSIMPDPHAGPSSEPRSWQPWSDFMRPDGAFVDVCGGGPCQSNALG
jgi:hypothetical protein